jgi:hypothetical protein
LFAFRRAEETILPELNKLIKEKDEVVNDLVGNIAVTVVVSECLFPMIEALVRQCDDRLQMHIFRFLQVLEPFVAPPSLENRVRLCKVISSFDKFRREVVHGDLLGDAEKIVSD